MNNSMEIVTGKKNEKGYIAVLEDVITLREEMWKKKNREGEI